MSLTRHILTSSAQLTLANALARALGIISLPLLTHWLAPAAYGQAALAGTLISLVSVIGLMGMDMSYARAYLSRVPPNGLPVETFAWRFAGVAALAAGVVAALAWLLHARHDQAAMPGMALLVLVGAGGSLLLAMAQTRCRLHNRHGRLAIAVASGGAIATATTLLLAWGVVRDERALVAGYVAAYLIPIAIMGLPRLLQLRRPSGLTADARKAVFLVGLPGVVTAPMYWVVSSADRWFLQASADSAAVGVYAIACTFGQLGMMVNSALLAIWLPEATRLHEAGIENSDVQLARLITRLVLVMAAVCVGVSLFGVDLLRWLTAEKFHAAVGAVPIIAGAVFFHGCYHIARTGLFINRSLGVAALIAACGAAASLMANALLIPLYGIFAAAAVQCGSFAVIALAVIWFSQRRHPLPLPMARLFFGILLLASSLVTASELPPAANFLTMGNKIFFFLVAIGLLSRLMEPGLIGKVFADGISIVRRLIASQI